MKAYFDLFQALAGERFVEYVSEECNNDHITFGETYRHGSPSRRPPSSPTKTTPQHNANNPGNFYCTFCSILVNECDLCILFYV